jgi:hypothetical protein
MAMVVDSPRGNNVTTKKCKITATRLAKRGCYLLPAQIWRITSFKRTIQYILYVNALRMGTLNDQNDQIYEFFLNIKE